MNQAFAEQVVGQFKGDVNEHERKFMEDVRSLMNFALDNSLSAHLVMDVLGHDIAGLREFSFDIARAKAKGFLPKVHGFTMRVQES